MSPTARALCQHLRYPFFDAMSRAHARFLAAQLIAAGC